MLLLLIILYLSIFVSYHNELQTKSEFDVIIIGAGLSGLTQLRLLRAAGFKVIVLEQGDDIGGTWYWNRYPGARVDIRNYDYYMHHSSLNNIWNFSEEFPGQPELHQYINKIDKVFNLKSNIRFKTKVTDLIWDLTSETWSVLSYNHKYTANFVILATGPLSQPNKPNFSGLSDFKGNIYYSARWPSIPINFTGKKVGILGTGSSGVQLIPIIAEQSDHLTVFQRTPNYVFPLRNRPTIINHFDKEERRKKAFNSPSGIPIYEESISYAELGKEKFIEQLEYYYQNIGGFDFMYSIISDLVINVEADMAVQDFIRTKIQEIVIDPNIAKKLSPNYGYICKRPLLGTNYYETYNKPNVVLIDTSINQFIAEGVITNNSCYPFDAFIFANGFDAFIGAINNIHIVGKNKQILKDKYDNYVKSYLGLMTAGFPNLFHLVTFQSPSVFTNMAVAIEQHTSWVSDLLIFMREKNHRTIEATVQAENDWVNHVNQCAKRTLWSREECHSWYYSNKKQFLPYCGGFDVYDKICRDIANKGYYGFIFDEISKDEL